MSVAAATVNYSGKDVAAGAGHRYVLVDCRIEAPSTAWISKTSSSCATALSWDTRPTWATTRTTTISIGPTWMGRVVPPAGSHRHRPVAARLAFKVPVDAARGYLFYWGLYWGPFDFR